MTFKIESPAPGVSIHQPLITMVQAFIRFQKLLVGIINGGAIGIAATMVALCDVLYASENAFFYTPFTALGLCAEGCSSVTFPKILGYSKACEMLMLNHKMDAREALAFGFISGIYKDEREVWDKLEQIKRLPIASIITNKNLMRRFSIDELELANLNEVKGLEERMQSPEALEAMVNFQMSRKNKSKL